MAANDSGARGEITAADVFERAGWKLLVRHPQAYGHTLDWLAADPDGVECLVEVKSWGSEPTGKDSVKKALADARDLKLAGETRPYVLVLTHVLGGLHGEMLRRARDAGDVDRVLVVLLEDHP